jgi:hypothetical protein
MRYFFIALTALFFALPSQAAVPINDEFVAAYQKNCMAQRNQRMTMETQDSFCACTGQKMKETMTVDDIQTMGGQDQAARNMLNKVMLDVYVPCMDGLVREMVNDECMANNQVDAGNARLAPLNINKNDLCKCMSDKTGAWYVTNGRSLMTKVLADNPNIVDPMTPVTESQEYKDAVLQNMLSCVPGPAAP